MQVCSYLSIKEDTELFLEKFQAGEAVIAVMLGNSIGMGYNATGYEAIHTRYNDSRGFAVEHRLDGSIGHPALLVITSSRRTLLPN